MLSFITQAAENFCIHQIRLPHTVNPNLPKTRTLIAYLDVKSKDGSEFRTYIGCDSTLIQCISELFLGEENSQEETLKDMLLETTNMVIGSAKVLASESSEFAFTISTPHILENTEFSMPLDEYCTIVVAGGEMGIAIKAT